MNRFMQSLKKRVIAFALVAVVIAAAGGWWYVSYYTRTPEYSIKMVQEAVRLSASTWYMPEAVRFWAVAPV
ncbi:MAG: hypothetical protein IIW84_08900 [Selenomonadaceae bacterium]|nr:hypothetical protein [Selenomonadaceae bacterium]